MADALPPRFTIVIPTRDRPRRLASCLEAVSRLRFPRERFEAVVVDDGGRQSIDATVTDVAAAMEARIVRQSPSGPGAARNRGAREARGEVLVFLDDDCAPAPDWLDALDSALAANPGAGVGGRTVNALPENLWSSASQALIDYLYRYYNTGSGPDPMFTTSNLALPRAEFARLGGFHARFLHAGGEDRELCLRWVRAGGRLVYAPDAIVHHFHSLTPRGFLRQHFTYGRGAAHFHRLRGSGPIPEPVSFYRELVLYPWRRGLPGRARMSALLALSQIANAAGYAWELRPRASRL
ncbi:MAG TPA: glycosyltransferase [Gemmatimonadota bacterium]|nr:glycosyltransferase [Gemmatimonadota bacterium]